MIAVLLTILFISVGFRDVLSILYFYSNQSYIANNLCINKDQPEKNCHGKCYLSQLLNENNDGKDESPPINRLFDRFELKVLPSEISDHGFLIERLKGKANWAFRNLLYQSDYFHSLFQPPEIPS
jgi:hypothetical protein